MKVARDKLKEIGPDEVNMEEYKVSATFGLLAVRAHAFQSSVGNIPSAKLGMWFRAVPAQKAEGSQLSFKGWCAAD